MKYDEIKDPKCDRCEAPSLSHYRAKLNAQGDVLEVYCDHCGELEDLQIWDKDHRLHSYVTLTAVLKTHTAKPGADKPDHRWFEISQASQRVHAHVKEYFEPSVWFGHAGGPFVKTPTEYGGVSCGFGTGKAMAKVVRASTCAWMTSGDIIETAGKYTVKTWCTAGRCLVEIESDDARITLITAEDEDAMRMGVQGIDATEAQALDLLNRAEMAWRGGGYTLMDAPNGT